MMRLIKLCMVLLFVCAGMKVSAQEFYVLHMYKGVPQKSSAIMIPAGESVSFEMNGRKVLVSPSKVGGSDQLAVYQIDQGGNKALIDNALSFSGEVSLVAGVPVITHRGSLSDMRALMHSIQSETGHAAPVDNSK